jgi:hypothetical protein
VSAYTRGSGFFKLRKSFVLITGLRPHCLVFNHIHWYRQKFWPAQEDRAQSLHTSIFHSFYKVFVQWDMRLRISAGILLNWERKFQVWVKKKEENLKKLRTVFKTDLWGRDQICIVWQRLGSKSFFLVSRGPIGFELQTHCSADRVPRMVNQFLRNSSGSESVVTFCNLLAII